MQQYHCCAKKKIVLQQPN